MFENYWGNEHVVRALEGMIGCSRIPQTLLFSGPLGVGKATLARRFAQALLPHPEMIERDDLSLAENMTIVAGREKWPAEKRNEDPLLFATHPDFVTFAPDGPLRQLSIPQMRELKERAQFLPSHGKHRVFLIDHIDRSGDQAANSLLKILEEPPPYLVLIATAENAYDLLPTIRSRSVLFQFSPLSTEKMQEFADGRELKDSEQRLTLAQGSPGLATAPFTVTGAGSHTVNYWSADKAGNVETTHTVATSVTPPTTTGSLSGTSGTNGWYTSAVTVTLTATAGTLPIAATYYTVDGGSQQTYSAPFTVSGDSANHTVTFYSVDTASNAETAHSQTVKIDGTAPTLTFGAASPAANNNGWNNSAVSIPYTDADATSGVASATPGSPLTFASEGANQTQSVTVTDNAGNSAAFSSPAVSIDLTAPVTTASVSGATVTLAAADSLSGVAATYYTIDGGAQQTYTAPFTRHRRRQPHAVAYHSRPTKQAIPRLPEDAHNHHQRGPHAHEHQPNDGDCGERRLHTDSSPERVSSRAPLSNGTATPSPPPTPPARNSLAAAAPTANIASLPEPPASPS